MTINELKNWMREQLEQGNSIAVVTAGQGGSGYALAEDEAIIADVDNYDDNEISIVKDDDELEMLKAELAGDDNLCNYDAVVKLSNENNNIIYIFYTAEAPSDIVLTKGSYNMGDNLTWSFMGEDYCCTGEFYVDNDNMLHHTFFAPSGREIEIVTPYE